MLKRSDPSNFYMSTDQPNDPKLSAAPIDDCDFKFEVQNHYTVEDFQAFWVGFRQKPPGKALPKQASPHSMRMLSCFMIFAGVAIEITYFWVQPFADLPSLKYAWVFCILGLITFIRGVPQHPHWVQKAWKNYQKQQWEYFTISFTCADFQLHFSNQSGISNCHYSYSFIQQLWEDEDHFYMNVNSHTSYILQKSGFTKGNPSDFSKFLTEKTGKPVVWINGKRPH